MAPRPAGPALRRPRGGRRARQGPAMTGDAESVAIAGMPGIAGVPGIAQVPGNAGVAGNAGSPGWVIGRRWHIVRPLSTAPEAGRTPYVAADLFGEYPFEVVVKIIAPPPGVAGWQGLGERRHAQMEMSLPLGHVHENIAEVLDCDLDPDYGSYIVTRLYPNTLERYLQEASGRDSLTLGEALRLAEQMLAGLRAAWDR